MGDGTSMRTAAGEQAAARSAPVASAASGWEPPQGCGPEVEGVLRAVRASLWSDAGTSAAEAAAGLDAAAVRLAAENRLAILALTGVGGAAARLAPAVRETLEAHRQFTLRMNTANLMTVRQVLPLMAAAGIDTLVFKGPVAQQRAYGGYFLKPSSDVDLLVAERDFDRAREVLAQGGHALADQCDTPWWRVFLGEQHLLSDDRMRATVDLHHRLQQPGSPAPRRPERFLAERETVAVAGLPLPTLSRVNALLLSCMSLAKALAHREAAGGHVGDLAANLSALDAAGRARLEAAARAQGLTETLKLGVHAARVLFGVEAVEAPSAAPFGVSDLALTRMILTPFDLAIDWPRRQTMLWSLCDSKLAYPGELAWAAAAELCRRAYEPRVPTASAPAPA